MKAPILQEFSAIFEPIVDLFFRQRFSHRRKHRPEFFFGNDTFFIRIKSPEGFSKLVLVVGFVSESVESLGGNLKERWETNTV